MNAPSHARRHPRSGFRDRLRGGGLRLLHEFTRSMRGSIRFSFSVEHSLALLVGYSLVGAAAARLIGG